MSLSTRLGDALTRGRRFIYFLGTVVVAHIGLVTLDVGLSFTLANVVLVSVLSILLGMNIERYSARNQPRYNIYRDYSEDNS